MRLCIYIGEADLYGANRQLLRLAGMLVADAAPISLMGLDITPGPRVVPASLLLSLASLLLSLASLLLSRS